MGPWPLEANSDVVQSTANRATSTAVVTPGRIHENSIELPPLLLSSLRMCRLLCSPQSHCLQKSEYLIRTHQQAVGMMDEAWLLRESDVVASEWIFDSSHNVR